MNDEDEGVARIFRALCDPTSLRLLLHVLEVGEYDTNERLLDKRARSDDVHLDHLVHARLMVRTPREDGTGVYSVTDAATIERLLATVRQLGTRNRET